MLKDCTHRKENPRELHNLKEFVIVEDVLRTTPQIYVALDNHQADHQSTIVEVGGKIAKKSISVLIDRGSTHSYVSPKVVEIFLLGNTKHNNSWLVQLATGTKRKVSEVVMECPIELNALLTKENFQCPAIRVL